MAYATKQKTKTGIKPLGSNLYGTCSTAAGTATKTVTMPDFDVLVEGVTIHVYFTNTNTANSPKLKVGGTAATSIKRNGSTTGKWENGSVISFTYDGTYWVQNDADEGSGGGNTYGLTYDSATGTLSIVENGGSLSVTIDDEDTTYTISISGHTITLTPSSGSPQSVTVPDDDTTYTISKSGNIVTLTGSDGSTSSFTDAGTDDYNDLTNKPQINSITLQGNLTSEQLGLLDFFYPVGSYYETSNKDFDPNTEWGGTWVKELKGMIHVSGDYEDASYPVAKANDASGVGQKDGGEVSHILTPSETATKNHSHTYSKSKTATNGHALTLKEMPSHAHNVYWNNYNRGTGSSATMGYILQNTSASSQGWGQTADVGDGASHTHGIGFTDTATTGNPTNANGTAHNNMQPYINVFRWHRTA